MAAALPGLTSFLPRSPPAPSLPAAPLVTLPSPMPSHLPLLARLQLESADGSAPACCPWRALRIAGGIGGREREDEREDGREDGREVVVSRGGGAAKGSSSGEGGGREAAEGATTRGRARADQRAASGERQAGLKRGGTLTEIHGFSRLSYRIEGRREERTRAGRSREDACDGGRGWLREGEGRLWLVLAVEPGVCRRYFRRKPGGEMRSRGGCRPRDEGAWRGASRAEVRMAVVCLFSEGGKGGARGKESKGRHGPPHASCLGRCPRSPRTGTRRDGDGPAGTLKGAQARCRA